MINVTFRLARAKKTVSGVVVGLRGDDPDVLDGLEWQLADQPHPDQPVGCVTIWHWCSGSYRWLDAAALDQAMVEQ